MENYIFIDTLGSGSFGEVYLVEYKNGNYMAAKIEERKDQPRIINEFNIYKHLQAKKFVEGIPTVYDFIQGVENNVMIMQLLGPNLEDLFKKYHRKFDYPTVFKMGIQFVELMQQLHEADYIHRDIKPNNFLIGRGFEKKQIHIMDFGLSKKYIINGKHIPFRNEKPLIGTVRYSSRNMHMGIEPSRRDDLESIAYMLIYFLRGSLPWQGLRKTKGTSHLEVIGECKLSTSIDSLCKGIPSSFREFLEYTMKLKFDETPDYVYMKKLFVEQAKQMNIVPKFIWEEEKEENK